MKCVCVCACVHACVCMYMCVCVCVCVCVEVASRIAKASRAFRCLKKSMFDDKNFSVATKRYVYCAAMLPVLLYGVETWMLKSKSARRLEVFHNRCIRTILGVSRYEQWKKKLLSRSLAASFGLPMTIIDLICELRLR